ncbi:MAG: DUF2007 domain-containing protein [Rhizobiaceae bacterium]
MRTNDPVLVNFVETLFNEQNIDHIVLDTNMSILEGSIGIIPRRIMVTDEYFARAGRLLEDAGLEKELSREK